MAFQPKQIYAACSAIALFATAGQAAIEESFTISGTVNDHLKKPVSGAVIKVTDERDEVLSTSTTNGNGHFKLTHPACERCSISVLPPAKSRLASANLSDIPGKQSRKVLINLHRGFLVAGKVLGGGKALKGITVRASDDSGEKSVHGGGDTVTANDGSFTLVLTPGKKKLQLFNNRFPEFATQSEHVFNVIEDCRLPEVTLSKIR